MSKVFYRITYTFEGREFNLFGALHNSLIQTIVELQLGGINDFRVELLTAEDFNGIENRPYNIPTE